MNKTFCLKVYNRQPQPYTIQNILFIDVTEHMLEWGLCKKYTIRTETDVIKVMDDSIENLFQKCLDCKGTITFTQIKKEFPGFTIDPSCRTRGGNLKVSNDPYKQSFVHVEVEGHNDWVIQSAWVFVDGKQVV